MHKETLKTIPAKVTMTVKIVAIIYVYKYQLQYVLPNTSGTTTATTTTGNSGGAAVDGTSVVVESDT